MLTILIAIGIVVFLVWLLGVQMDINLGIDSLGSIAITVIGVAVLCTLVFPFAGYHEPELIQETELVSLSNTVATSGGGNIFYVSVSPGNVYSYRYEVKNKSYTNEKAYKRVLVSGNDTEIETDTEVAILRKYVQKPKRWLWTFALGTEKYKYEFIVPKGSIVKEITLN